MQKHEQWMKWLTDEHGMTHGLANLIALQTPDARRWTLDAGKLS
jgi:hypothetical protein